MVKDKLGAAAASAPKGDPTGKYTLNEADFAFFDLAQDKVELKSDGWRTEKIADDPNVYEWWYFDIHNHDGTIVTGMLSPQTAIGRVPRFGTPDLQVIRSCRMSESELRAELKTISSDKAWIDDMVAAMTPHGFGRDALAAS